MAGKSFLGLTLAADERTRVELSRPPLELSHPRKWFEDSWVWQQIIADGRAEGRILGLAEGEARGRVEEARRLLILIGTERLGEPARPIVAALNSVDDLDLVEHLVVQALTASTWIELVEVACNI